MFVGINRANAELIFEEYEQNRQPRIRKEILKEWSKVRCKKWCSKHRHSNSLLEVLKHMDGKDIVELKKEKVPTAWPLV
eukprot:TRINITY_DN2658_c0_g1_i1.p2 TRINITY_DN2658_c0_g1~~TRINITY_DN2658_c0_g1_i1.p2  ORF type:complete len:79 (+),score=8.28 TRINITY_DN2658_c0_g1_i1:174-410(+)